MGRLVGLRFGWFGGEATLERAMMDENNAQNGGVGGDYTDKRERVRQLA
jgi:hypothetical protein